MATFHGKMPELISSKTLRRLREQYNQPYTEPETNRIINNAGTFYHEYIESNLIAVVLIGLLCVCLLIRYMWKQKTNHETGDFSESDFTTSESDSDTPGTDSESVTDLTELDRAEMSQIIDNAVDEAVNRSVESLMTEGRSVGSSMTEGRSVGPLITEGRSVGSLITEGRSVEGRSARSLATDRKPDAQPTEPLVYLSPIDREAMEERERRSNFDRAAELVFGKPTAGKR